MQGNFLSTMLFGILMFGAGLYVEQRYHPAAQYMASKGFGPKSFTPLSAKGPIGQIAQSTPPARAEPQQVAAQTPAQQPMNNPLPPLSKTSAKRIPIRVGKVVLKRVSKDMVKVMKDAHAEPQFNNGTMIGYKLTQVRRTGVFALLGFREGDIIREINDVPVVNKNDGSPPLVELFNVQTGNNVIALERAGKVLILEHQLK